MHEALVKCCSATEKSLSKMSSSDQDITPDLEETEEQPSDTDNDGQETLTGVLQKISDCKSVCLGETCDGSSSRLVCFAPKEHGVRKLREWMMKSEPRAREQLHSLSSLTIDQSSTLVDTTFSRTSNVKTPEKIPPRHFDCF